MELISTREAAKRLGVDVATINRWAASGTVPAAGKAPGVRGARLYDAEVIDGMVEAVA